jgi:hypothetical protein
MGAVAAEQRRILGVDGEPHEECAFEKAGGLEYGGWSSRQAKTTRTAIYILSGMIS